tara:strand:- start:151 stop:444 length:294 start_codon:yes stop_codon:yes gene_type:complete
VVVEVVLRVHQQKMEVLVVEEAINLVVWVMVIPLLQIHLKVKMVVMEMMPLQDMEVVEVVELPLADPLLQDQVLQVRVELEHQIQLIHVEHPHQYLI